MASAPEPRHAAVTAPGRPASELTDAELESQGTRAHETRNWVFLHGTAEQFARHTSRMLELEGEYLRRHPHRTWQGIEGAPDPVGTHGDGGPPCDPVTLVLGEIAASPGGRLHKLEVHQLARRSGLDRSALATLYTAAEPLLVADQQDRVITEAGLRRLRDGMPSARARTENRAVTEYTWRFQERAVWDADKQRIVGGAPVGIFNLSYQAGDSVPGDWWAVVDTAGDVERVVGFGWMDVTWGEAEILLAVAADAQQGGVGSFILEHLEIEAADRGLNYVYNTVLETHPQRSEVQDWLGVRGFRGDGEDQVLRKKVDHGDRPPPPTTTNRAPAPSAASVGSSPTPTRHSGGDLGPGREDRGGYVDVEDHQY